MSSLRLSSRADVLSATRNHPYARFATAAATSATGVTDGRATAWVNESAFGLLGHVIGELDDALALFVAAQDLLAPARWVNLPRHPAERRPAGQVVFDEWDLRWWVDPPPPLPAEVRVVELGDNDAADIDALLDLAMPETPVRPGSDLARAFVGIWERSELVACAADRSSRVAHGPGASVGVIGAVAVHPDHRRRGLGAAITARIARRLATEHALVVLGQQAGNDDAARVYQRLGFTGIHTLTAVRPG